MADRLICLKYWTVVNPFYHLFVRLERMITSGHGRRLTQALPVDIFSVIIEQTVSALPAQPVWRLRYSILIAKPEHADAG